MIVVMVLSLIIQNRLSSRFEKYSQVPLGLTGAEVASRMLQAHGIRDVKIVSIEGKLTDHYDPTTKTVNLSENVYYGKSVAAAAVAAHECGHVVQHATGYAWLRMRSALVPVVSFSSNIVSWVLLAGVIFINTFPSLLWIGEINASARAVSWLESAGIVGYETKPMAVDALKWAAYTYVIAALGSLATLLYYISIGNSRRS